MSAGDDEGKTFAENTAQGQLIETFRHYLNKQSSLVASLKALVSGNFSSTSTCYTLSDYSVL